MAGNAGGFEDYPLAPGSYSELLFGDYISGLDLDGLSGFDSYFSPEEYTDNLNNNGIDDKDPKMAAENFRITGRISGPACTNSSMTISDYIPQKKRNGSGIQNTGSNCGALTGSQKNKKKPKSDSSSTVSGHAKDAKKEKLRDRITALQQLVSPFGKTDTASVLHEASGYIRFLHDQVQVLSSPYLQSLSTPALEDSPCTNNGDGKEMEIRRKSVLRSRGLCLVPMELTLHVADSNGADLWSSAAAAEPLSRLSKVSLQIA